MKLTQRKDSFIMGRVSPAFAEITVDLTTEEAGMVEVTFDYETFREMMIRVPSSHRPIIPERFAAEPDDLDEFDAIERSKLMWGSVFVVALLVISFGLGFICRGLF